MNQTTYAAPRKSFIEAGRICLNAKYADFTGRASRSEFWWFYLIVLVAQVLAFNTQEDDSLKYMILSYVLLIVFLVPE